MAASVVGFSFARFVAQDWVAARIPAGLRKYDEALKARAFQTVVVLRLVRWMPQPLHFFSGVSRVGFWTQFWGSVVGYAPTLPAVGYFGNLLFDASGRLQPDGWPIGVGMVLASIPVAAIARLMERRRRASSIL